LKFEITDNSETFIEEKDEAIKRALEKIGITAEAYAKLKCPVDTGLLRNSITHAVGGDTISVSYRAKYGSNRSKKGNRLSATSKNAGTVAVGRYRGTIGESGDQCVYIGTNVEYAAYVEFGTSNTPAQPFLKPAVLDHMPLYRRIALAELKGQD
jgi:HK97 gp10 family phage protein